MGLIPGDLRRVTRVDQPSAKGVESRGQCVDFRARDLGIGGNDQVAGDRVKPAQSAQSGEPGIVFDVQVPSHFAQLSESVQADQAAVAGTHPSFTTSDGQGATHPLQVVEPIERKQGVVKTEPHIALHLPHVVETEARKCRVVAQVGRAGHRFHLREAGDGGEGAVAANRQIPGDQVQVFQVGDGLEAGVAHHRERPTDRLEIAQTRSAGDSSAHDSQFTPYIRQVVQTGQRADVGQPRDLQVAPHNCSDWSERRYP